jgi:hypothetical protein
MTESNGTYLVFAQTTTAQTLNDPVTIVNSSWYSLTAFGATVVPEAGPNQYLLTVTNSPVTVFLNSANPREVLTGFAPWSNSSPTSIQFTSTLTNSATFSTTNQVSTACETNSLQFDVLITVFGTPPFDIPVSTPSTNNCTNFLNGTPTINQ